jgi:hypothetical protein
MEDGERIVLPHHLGQPVDNRRLRVGEKPCEPPLEHLTVRLDRAVHERMRIEAVSRPPAGAVVVAVGVNDLHPGEGSHRVRGAVSGASTEVR